ncbi:hypothetical protein [Streptomyces sp. ID38640]|uniref:hypothetical protein n=2 Tax=Streptomyces TaxID=1883 RepID=UPI002180BAD2|nr:hypothetical protein [Streptomyces sp. ID38640]
MWRNHSDRPRSGVRPDLQAGSPPLAPESVEAVRRTLERLAQGFALSVHGSDGRVRFRRFGLVN